MWESMILCKEKNENENNEKIWHNIITDQHSTEFDAGMFCNRVIIG